MAQNFSPTKRSTKNPHGQAAPTAYDSASRGTRRFGAVLQRTRPNYHPWRGPRGLRLPQSGRPRATWPPMCPPRTVSRPPTLRGKVRNDARGRTYWASARGPARRHAVDSGDSRHGSQRTTWTKSRASRAWPPRSGEPESDSTRYKRCCRSCFFLLLVASTNK